ncbi:MAG TPA: hypothetical protein VFH22_06860 [Rhodocyclaceae bacterium]|nr:hypothetical protein [Rhodocyclaceae bacterium]
MKTLFSALTLALLMSVGVAHADVKADCEAKALSKDGKPLAGAAKDTKVKKCMADAGAAAAAPASAAAADCEAKAVDKNGKKLAGAAKNAFMKKCEKDAAAPAAEAKPAADAKPVAAKK